MIHELVFPRILLTTPVIEETVDKQPGDQIVYHRPMITYVPRMGPKEYIVHPFEKPRFPSFTFHDEKHPTFAHRIHHHAEASPDYGPL